MKRRHILFSCLVLGILALPTSAADLSPRAASAFDQYVRLTEARMTRAQPFLWIDTIPPAQRLARQEELRRTALLIERLTTRDGGRTLDAPGALIHHWLGAAFVPGATVDQALALLQAYDAHADVYRPAVARSRVLARDGDTFRVSLRFFMKQVITVVVNSEHEARFTRSGSRAEGRIRSTRIAEVEDPDTPGEREKPVGRDNGFLWRLNTYWRLLEREGGLYIECESISLSRGIPTGFGWLIGPYVSSIPRETLTFTLETTRNRLVRAP